MKDLKISKELIIKVMDIKYPFSDVQLNNNILSWWREDVYFEETVKINIYEFAYKCKEWALSKGYFIYSTNELSFIKSLSLETIETFSNGKDTEIDCIIKACELIVYKENK